MKCEICDKYYYYRNNIEGDCPYCNRDSYVTIQHDINYMYRTFGYSSIKSINQRLNRLWNRQYLIRPNYLRFSTN